MTKNPLLSRHIWIAAIVLAAVAGLPENSHAGSPSGAGICEPARPYGQGLTPQRIVSGERTRHFDLYVPESYSGKAAVPLIVDLHASGISPGVELKITGMDRAAEKRGFVVVVPAAVTEFPKGGTTWNTPWRDSGVDDVAFVEDVLRAVSFRLCIDQKRIYVTGFSGGARLASELACRMPDRIAAISAVGGLRHPHRPEGHCTKGSRAVSILAIHSVDDPINTFRHDPKKSPPYWTYGVEEAYERWLAHNACGSTGSDKRITARIVKNVHDDCRNGSVIEFYRLSSTGHTWPGSDFAFPDYLGATESGLDATELTLRFFERIGGRTND